MQFVEAGLLMPPPETIVTVLFCACFLEAYTESDRFFGTIYGKIQESCGRGILGMGAFALHYASILII
jgi:hypothetical protein